MTLRYAKKQLKTLLALCFTDAPETSHHWRVFAPGSTGVCIRFNKSKLLDTVDKQTGFQHQKVKYKTFEKLEKRPPLTNILPFLKRYAYRDEEEYRLIYSDKKAKSKQYKHLKINVNIISKIVLSPLLHKSLVASLKETLKSIEGCQRLTIGITTINDSKRWARTGEKSV